MKIAITAPTGHIGRLLVKALLDQGGHDLVLLARDPQKLSEETKRGAVVKKGNLEDASYLAESTRGVEELFFLIPPSPMAPDVIGYYKTLAENAAKAIQANKVKRAVLLSSVGAHQDGKTGPVRGLHAAEEIFRKTGADITFLRPGYFMENFLEQMGAINAAGAIYLPVPGAARVPFIATRDIAAEAAKVLTDETWSGQRVLELHGPADLTFDEVAAAIGRGIGKEVKHVQVPPEAAAEEMVKMGLGKNFVDLLVEMHVSLGTGDMKAENPRSEAVTTPTTLEAFAKETMAVAEE